MRNTMKRILSAAALLAATATFADTAEIDGRTWTYYVVGKNAAIISATKKSGEMVVPLAFVTGGTTNVVTSIANGAFADDVMTSVKIPTNVTSIGEGAFAGCKGLKSVTIPQCVCESGLWSVFDAENIVKVVIQDGVTEIGDYAFSGCYNLVSVTLPLSVRGIGDCAFMGCAKLESVTIAGGAAGVVGNDQYDDKRRVGISAFEGCRNLKTVDIPDGVRCIDWQAFYNCVKLTAVELPDSVTEIRSRAFYGCSSLAAVNLPDGVWDPQGMEMSGGVYSIGREAFCGCSNLTEIEIPESIDRIESRAFANCYSLKDVTLTRCEESGEVFVFDDTTKTRQWENVVIRDGAWSETHSTGSPCVIGGFSDCPNLKTVVLPASVSGIADQAFRNCAKLESVTIADGVAATVDESQYPDQLRIGMEAFSGCTSLRTVDIPDGVRCVDWQAFYNCVKLTAVELPDSVMEIRSRAFYGCGLTSVALADSVTSVGESAFANCYALKDVTLSKSVFDVGVWEVFRIDQPESYPCAWEMVTVGEGVTNIAERVFEGLPNLKTVVLSRSVESIGTRAFANCGKLVDVLIPQGVETIGEEAFAGCGQLMSVALPCSVTDIRTRAFADCGALLDVLFEYDAPAFVGTDVFADVDADCIVWVERGSRGWNVDIPGTWKGVGIHYIPYTSYATCREGLVTTQIANGIRVASASAAKLTQADLQSVKISAMVMSDGTEADTTKGYSVATSADGLTATFTLKAAAVAMTEEEAKAEKDETDPAGALVTVDESAIEAKPAARADESVGALPVKETVKGLWYQAAWGNDLNNLTQGEKVQATGDNLYLGVIKQTGNCGFYRISVSEK